MDGETRGRLGGGRVGPRRVAGGCHETLGVGVLRGLEDLRDRAFLDHATRLHDEHPVGDSPDRREIMADEHHGDAAIGDLAEQPQDPHLNGGVEGRRRLIGDEDRRLGRER